MLLLPKPRRFPSKPARFSSEYLRTTYHQQKRLLRHFLIESRLGAMHAGRVNIEQGSNLFGGEFQMEISAQAHFVGRKRGVFFEQIFEKNRDALARNGVCPELKAKALRCYK